MANHHRRRNAAVALGTMLISGAATTAAYASTAYPPATPSPTVSGVKASNTTPPAQPAAFGVQAQQAATLPRTGTDAALWVIAGGGLIAGGSALVISSRRRTGSHAL
jgi:LPXTG-motif cell wall-anchored protein